MARSTRLVILIKNIYTLWGRKRFLLPVTYLPSNLVYPFTLRVTGIKARTRLGLRSSTSIPNIREEETLIMVSANASGVSRTTTPSNSTSTILNTSTTTTLNTTLSPTDIQAYVKQLSSFERTPGTLHKFVCKR